MVVAAGWWVAAVDADAGGRPALHRRLDQQQHPRADPRLQRPRPPHRQRDRVVGVGGGRGGSPFGGGPAWTRLFTAEIGGQISWLLPAALIVLVGIVWLSWGVGRARRTGGAPRSVGLQWPVGLDRPAGPARPVRPAGLAELARRAGRAGSARSAGCERPPCSGAARSSSPAACSATWPGSSTRTTRSRWPPRSALSSASARWRAGGTGTVRRPVPAGGHARRHRVVVRRAAQSHPVLASGGARLVLVCGLLAAAVFAASPASCRQCGGPGRGRR